MLTKEMEYECRVVDYVLANLHKSNSLKKLFKEAKRKVKKGDGK